MSEFPAPWQPPPTPHAVTVSRPDSPRLLVQLIWEGILLLAVALVAVLLGAAAHGALSQAGLWLNVAATGLVASGLALSLRTATPNLAVGAVAAAAAVGYAKLMAEDWSVPAAVGVVLLAAIVGGALLGVLIGLTSVPAWAASLFALAALQAITIGLSGGTMVVLRHGVLRSGEAVWTTLFLVVSIGGSALWLIPGVRAALSANRATADPTRFSAGRLVGAFVGTAGSTALAAAGGMLLVSRLGAAGPTLSGDLLLAGLAAALVGGVSVFGRRAGIAGTALGVVLVVLFTDWLTIKDAPFWARELAIAGLLLVGLLVSWLLELICRALDRPAGVAPGPPPPFPPPGG
ncbi:MAG: hypothetical protein AUI14_10925 [Actinobacteria bacterium 13_2_20CM_2_71_6]|nr:MAG: hypothetical protein AUI14_10925 [Actinobacteria bacterium 13_2_20CM_2_71_6]